ncbi:MAG TPA: hypothetical protein VKS99_15600 [Blastocatellia bacterium]|nr:hypothetical protein [Blastocatellia bacterium]
MNVRKNLIIAVVWLFALSVLVIAQGPSPRKGPPGFDPQIGRPDHGPGLPFPPDHGLSILSPEMRFDGKVVKGAPYSATAVTESTQTLSNGARITHKTTASIYRDSEGRTRREMTLDRVGPFATADEPTQLIFINDPVAGVHYILDQRSHTARKMAAPPDDRTPRRPPSERASERASDKSPERAHGKAPGESKTESLGKQAIEGVEAEGVRSVITIPEGRIGNDRPIEIVSERWDSSELQTVVLSKHNDPRFGETVYRLTNINRAEPAQALFEVPADYKVEEGRPGGFFGDRRMKRPGDR